jgi:hypothetical protein
LIKTDTLIACCLAAFAFRPVDLIELMPRRNFRISDIGNGVQRLSEHLERHKTATGPKR